MFTLKRTNTLSEVEKDRHFEGYFQHFSCYFENDISPVTMKGKFIYQSFYGEIRGEVQFSYESEAFRVTRPYFEHMYGEIKKTEKFKCFLEKSKELNVENERKYKPVLQSWKKIAPGHADIKLEIQMESIDVPFEISFVNKKFTYIFPANGMAMYHKALPFFNGYIGWEKDVLKEIENKTPYRMLFIMS